MDDLYIYFYFEGEPILGISVEGLHDDEIHATKELLAYERKIKPSQIFTALSKKQKSYKSCI